MPDMVESGVHRLYSELCSDHFHCQFCQRGGLNKDPTVWLDGARITPNYHIHHFVNMKYNFKKG
jgi:hypothetical protein